MKIFIIKSQFNELITQALIDGAKQALSDRDIQGDHIDIAQVPGAFEIPQVASKAAKSDRYSAIICIGAIIRGETPHFDYLCQAVFKGLMEVSLHSSIPLISGVLVAENSEQALARCGIKSGNKGREAAYAAIQMMDLARHGDYKEFF